ncbi:MAG: GAF domain-containing protein [Bacteroidales bacterium]|jgi:ligand-binding sensor domain-containing protein
MKWGKRLRVIQPYLLLFIFTTVTTAKEVYKPQKTNPLFESWRWKAFSELSDKGIRSLIEGEDHTIWFGTGKGLYFYDGLDFRNYHDENDILSSPVYGLYLTGNSGLYAVSLKGICHFEKGKWHTVFLFPPDHVLGSEWEILNIVQTSNGDLWVALYFGLLRLRNGEITLFTDSQRIAGSEAYFTEVSVEYAENLPVRADRFIVYDVLEDSQGNMWFALEDGTTIRMNGSFSDFGSLASAEQYGTADGMVLGRLPVLFEASDGTVYNISQSVVGAVNSFTPYNSVWSATKLSDQFGGDDLNYSILETSDGTLWIGGLSRIFTLKDGVWNEYGQPELDIPQTRILLLSTTDGALWISGLLSDVFRIEYETSYWNTYRDLNFECETGEGNKWFLNAEGRVVVQEASTGLWFVLDTTKFPMDAPVRIYKDNSGFLWALGSHEGKAALAFNHEGNWQLKIFPDLCWGIHPQGVFQASDNSIWFGANADCGDARWGLYRYDPAKGDPSNEDAWKSFPGTEICEVAYSLGQSKDNHILCGYYKGLFEYTGESTIELHTELMNDIVKVESMEQDVNGGLWIGTRSHGIIYFTDQDEWKQYTVEDGLASNTVSCILVASDSTVWAVTDKGVSRFDGVNWLKTALPVFFKISRGNGSVRESADGSIWINGNSIEWYRRVYFNTGFGSDDSPLIAYKINPEKLPPETKIVQYDEKVYYPNNALIFWEGRDPWNHSSLNELQFSYRLDDGEWSEYNYERNHNFLSLKRGKHTLAIRARDKYLNVDNTPAKIEFKAIPPVWAQIWFIMLMAGLVTTIGYLFVITVRKNRESRAQNLEMVKKNEDLVKQQKEIEEKGKKIMELLETERETKWLNEGIIKIGDIIRKNRDDEKQLAQEIIAGIVHYIEVHYGGFFLYRKEDDKEYLELIAHYGFDSGRIGSREFLVQEGLPGTCFTEKRVMKVDNLPGDYVMVSGLGQAKLKSLVLIPLKYHEDVVGVFEVASVNVIEDKVVQLLETLSENIAATIIGIESRKKIETMYDDSQQQTTKLHEQEEELRQQMEELHATQEERQRREEELLKIIDTYKKKELSKKKK